jgi:hypothetical protein
MATANDIIKKAISQIDVKENPAGSNKVKYNTDYYGRAVVGNAYPWCCTFVWWIFKQCGASSLFYGGEKTAYCPTVETYYRKKGQWHTNNPKPGDLVLFDFTGSGIAGHIGILEKINADGTYNCIEGNTGTGNDANGGCVMRRKRNRSVIRGFARPSYNGTTTNTVVAKNATTTKESNTVDITLNILKTGSKGNQVKTLQRLLISLGHSCGSSGADGDFGSATLKAVNAFQTKNKLTADGIVGANTWNALLK